MTVKQLKRLLEKYHPDATVLVLFKSQGHEITEIQHNDVALYICTEEDKDKQKLANYPDSKVLIPEE